MHQKERVELLSNHHLGPSISTGDASSMLRPLPPSRNEQRLYQQERARQQHRHAQLPLSVEGHCSSVPEVTKIHEEENVVLTKRDRLVRAIKKQAAEIAACDKRRDEEKTCLACGFTSLCSSTSIPSACPSQQWCAMMRQVIGWVCELLMRICNMYLCPATVM